MSEFVPSWHNKWLIFPIRLNVLTKYWKQKYKIGYSHVSNCIFLTQKMTDFSNKSYSEQIRSGCNSAVRAIRSNIMNKKIDEKQFSFDYDIQNH